MRVICNSIRSKNDKINVSQEFIVIFFPFCREFDNIYSKWNNFIFNKAMSDFFHN